MDSIKQQKILRVFLIAEAVLLFLCLLFGALEFSYRINNKASLLRDSIRNDYVLNDQKSLLQKIQIATISHDFQEVAVVPPSDKALFRSGFFILENQIPLRSVPNHDDSEILAQVIFTYSVMPGLYHGLILWCFVTLILLVLLPFLKSNLEKHLLKEMELQKMRELHVVTSRVAHDMRSPLSALNALVHGVVDIAPEHKEILAQVSNRINGIANDLLDQNRQQSTKKAIPQKKASRFFTELRPTLENIFREKSLEYRDTTSKKILLRIQGLDQSAKVNFPERDLFRIISNLVNNAMEAIPDEGSVTIQSFLRNDQATVIVFDSGVGMAEEVISQVLTTAYSSKAKGSGIGLSSAYELVRKYGGDIKIQSKLGIGTQISLYLPLA